MQNMHRSHLIGFWDKFWKCCGTVRTFRLQDELFRYNSLSDRCEMNFNYRYRPTHLCHLRYLCMSLAGIVQRLDLLFVSFSAYSNLRRIFTLRTKPGHISAIDGIRALSFCYIVWGQTYVWGPLYTESYLTGKCLFCSMLSTCLCMRFSIHC